MIFEMWGQIRNRIAVLLHDLLWVPVSLFLAFSLRFNLGPIPPEQWLGFLWMAGCAMPVFTAAFWFFGLYRGTWRFVSISDLMRLFKTVALGVLGTALLVFLLRRFEGVPRSVLILFPVLLALGLGAPRLVYRWVLDRRIGFSPMERQRALIVGAGRAGEMLLRNMKRTGHHVPVAFVDPDPAMKGKEIHGVRVVGGLDDITNIVQRTSAGIVILAIPEIRPEDLSKILEICVKLAIPCRTIPRRDASGEIIVDENKLRPVRIEDLLGRDPVVLNMEGISRHLRGKRVLVTGGGGSIGAELCRQAAALEPETLIVLDNSEFNLYEIDRHLTANHAGLEFVPLLCDAKDKETLEWVFARHRPQIVFHAAAYKHVPLLETNTLQAVNNNVMGTITVAGAAHRHGCEQFVLISTDKAVNPTNVMGATKRAAEIYCQNFNARSNTRFITTRFGNVLGSTGSVVPLFESQIASGGPVTVTHPDMERYFMTIPEAVGLILQAATMGKGGEIFVLEMGRPVNILHLAEQMIQLAGLKPYRDIPIIFTGLRPGEKLYEELFHESEGLIGTSNPKLLLAGFRNVEWEWLEAELAALEEIAQRLDTAALPASLKRIVPEFNPGQDLSSPPAPGGGKSRIRLVK